MASAASPDAIAVGTSLAEAEQVLNGDEDESVAMPRAARIIIRTTFGVNMFLIGVKIAAVLLSGFSLAVIGSLADSILDVLSQAVLLVSERARRPTAKMILKYPAGNARFSPLSVVVFASVMGTASIMLLREALQRLAQQEQPVTELPYYTMGAIAFVVITKLTLLVISLRYRRLSPEVAALASDHRNDIVQNTAVLATLVISFYFPAAWFLDATVAAIIALLICWVWGSAVVEHVKMLSGKTASHEILNAATAIAAAHAPDRVLAVDTVVGYHVGPRIILEVDIVMDPETPLRTTHDVSEQLQTRLEQFALVERAYVHVDHETDHYRADEHPKTHCLTGARPRHGPKARTPAVAVDTAPATAMVAAGGRRSSVPPA